MFKFSSASILAGLLCLHGSVAWSQETRAQVKAETTKAIKNGEVKPSTEVDPGGEKVLGAQPKAPKAPTLRKAKKSGVAASAPKK